MPSGQAQSGVGFDVEAGLDTLIPFPGIRSSFAWRAKIARGRDGAFGRGPGSCSSSCPRMLARCPSTDPAAASADIGAQPRVRRQISFLHFLARRQYLQRHSTNAPHTPHTTAMVTSAQYNDSYRHLHTLKVTATILTHLATPTIPGRHHTHSTRLPGIRSLFTIDAAQTVANILPPLQCAVGLINLGSPIAEHRSPVASPTKPVVVGSPTSPGMTPASPRCHGGATPAPQLTFSPKTRRPLTLHDLLSAETPLHPSTQRCTSVHHRRQCGIADCPKYALAGGFCIRHGGGKRCNFEGCQTVAQSGGRCKAHGGGSKCKVSGCGSVARRKGFCMTHGGRQQCKVDGCSKCAHGGGFCISHGGGKRCSSQACSKSAQAGGFCYSHGGGKRCAAPECFQAARKGGLCIRHRKQAAAVAARRWQASDSLLNLDEDDGPSLLPEGALEAETACQELVLDKLRERRDVVVQGGEKGKKDEEQVEDSLNVDEISDLFSCVEQEEASGVDFGVFIQDEDAVHMEEISQMFSGLDDSKTCTSYDSLGATASSPVDVVDTKQLEIQADADLQKALQLVGSFEDVAASQEQEEADAENVAMLSENFSATLEDKDAVEAVADSTPTHPLADCEDAKNVDLVADLFTSLEASSDAAQEVDAADRSATRDWIDALEVDNVASLFSELEQAEEMQTKTQTVAPAPVKVDSRIFVPTFSVRIEGGQLPRGRRPVVGPNSHLLVGPPGVLLAGPPVPSREERVGRWKSKRKTLSFATKQPEPSISDTRRASASKRQRVKGRFVSDTHTFVSITALQK
ncbi:hypothetical protein PHYPSEUDO_007151 [Phytophthora pseudosyringae]|uniref:CCT domain-containing protein n=1 Tax=Phytophthora pseudosyringae TaxID=221518 RepID=A0A8T1WGC0_9STRA|nr:hypothetical protein PHYPSEUDO_007151 [Phytophthora pseudosyringae]